MRWALAWSGLAACYAPVPPGGAPCTSQSDCPDGLICTATPAGDRCLTGPGGNPSVDGPTVDFDAPPADAPPNGCTTLLDGTSGLDEQGWERLRAGSTTITVNGNGTTITTTGGASRQLLVKRAALPTTGAWLLDVRLQVISAGGHGANEAAFAIMSSFTDPAGSDADRGRMVYIDEDAVGWGDAGVTIGLDTSIERTYRLERMGNGSLRFSLAEGGLSVGGGAFTTTGDIAIGDQSNVLGLESSVRILSVTRCL